MAGEGEDESRRNAAGYGCVDPDFLLLTCEYRGSDEGKLIGAINRRLIVTE